MASPLAQFEIKEIFPIKMMGYDISFTNSSLMMALTIFFIISFLYFGLKRVSLIPGKLQTLIELSYDFIGDMIRDNIGKEGLKYFPFIFTLFFSY